MPRMPDATSFGAPPSLSGGGGVASFSPVDMSAAGKELSHAGGEVEQAAQLVAETNGRQDAMVAEAALNKLQAQRLELEAGQQGFRNVRGGNAVGATFLDDWQGKFDTSKQLIEQGLTDNQRRIFQIKAPVAGLQYRSALLAHQGQETDKFNDQVENDTMDLARRDLFTNPADPAALSSGLARINWAIDQKAQRLGWAPIVTEEVKAKYTEKVYVDMAGVMVERDPVGSLQAMNKRLGIGEEAGDTGIPAFDKIPTDKLIEMRKRAFSYVKQEANANEAALKKREHDANEATNGLAAFAVTGQMVSPAYEQEVLGKVTGTPYEAQARALITASYAGAMHGSKPLPAQDADIRAMDAQLATQGSSPEVLKLASQIRSITDTQRREYKENPFAAATRFGRQPNVPEVQITSPDDVPKLISQRLQVMGGVEGYAGRPISPLQPNEAIAFAKSLDTLPPDQRSEVLAQTGALLSPARADALADQLDKHDRPLALALKMGMDRTTAGRAASTYVLAGAQALADKTVKKDESALAGWRAEIANLVRGTLGDDRSEQNVIDAAYYVRAALDKEGIAPNGFKPESASAEHAIGMVIGTPVTRGGQKTLLPRGMTESQFDDKLKTFTPEKLREFAIPSGTDVQRDAGQAPTFYVRGVPVSLEKVANRIPDAAMRRDGQGRYVPSINNAPVTLDPAGTQLLRLDVR